MHAQPRSPKIRRFLIPARPLLAFIAVFTVGLWFAGSSSAAPAVRQGEIRGTVRNSSGQGLSGAELQLSCGSLSRSAATNAGGFYHFIDVPSGACTLQVRRSGYSPLQRTGLTVNAGEMLTVNLVLHGTPSLGQVHFYDQSRFAAAELENPAAGGGYSDAASTNGARMLKQYVYSGTSGMASSRTALPLTSGGPAMQPGEAFLLSGKYRNAATWFRAALSRHPRSERAASGLGLAFYGEGRYSAAIDVLERAAAIAPDDPSPRLLMAESARFAPAKQPAVAQQLAAFSSKHRDSAAGHYAYSIILWEMFRRNHQRVTLQQARAECEQAVKLNPRDGAARNQLGILLDREGRIADAIHQYRDAIRLDPDRASTRYRLALDLSRSGNAHGAQSEMNAYKALENKGSR